MEDAVAPDVLDTREAGGIAVRGAALRGLGYAVVVAISVVSAAVLTRYLGVADFGRYTVVISLAAIVGAISEAGMTNVGIREYSTLAGEQRARLIANLLGLRIVLAALGVAAAVIFALAAGYDAQMVAGTAIAGGGLVLSVVQMTYAVPLATRLRLGWLAALDVLRQALMAAVIVGLAAVGAGLVPLFAAAPVAVAVATALTIRLVRGTVPLLPSRDRRQWAALLRLAAPYSAAVAVSAVYAYVVVIVVSLATSETETGVFSAAFRSFLAVAGLAGALVASAFPILARAARDDAERLGYALRLVVQTTLVVGAGLGVCVAVGAPIAIDIVAGSEYDAAVTPLRILAGAVVTTYVLSACSYALLAMRSHGAILAANVIGVSVTAGCAVVLAPAYGAEGGAFAIVAGEVALGTAYGVAVVRAGRLVLRPAATVLRAGLASGAGLAALLAPAPDLVRLAVAAAAFAGVAFAVRAVPRELLDAFLHRRPRAA